MVYGRMGQEGESTNWVKFQPVPASTERDRILYLADSGKKMLPGVERFRYRLFSGFADWFMRLNESAERNKSTSWAKAK